MPGLKLPWEIVAVLMDKKVVPDVLLCPHAESATVRVSPTARGARTMQPMSCADHTCYRRLWRLELSFSLDRAQIGEVRADAFCLPLDPVR